MQWSLEIASSSTPPERVADIINNEQVDNIIVRIGTAQGSEGFDNPSDYGNFLRAIAGLTNKPFYAIAGPNEPDEHWAAASCGGVNGSDPDATRATFYDCVGPALAIHERHNLRSSEQRSLALTAFNLTGFYFFDDDTGRQMVSPGHASGWCEFWGTVMASQATFTPTAILYAKYLDWTCCDSDRRTADRW